MTASLRARLMLTYMVMAALSVMAVGLSANLFLESGFTDYVRNRIANEKRQIVVSLANSWQSRQDWNYDELSVLGMTVLEQGFIIRVYATDGGVIWDARTHNNGLCEQMLANLAKVMDRRYTGWTGTLQEDSYPINVGGATVGTVRIGNYGPFWLNDSEVFFLGSLNQIVAIVSIATLVFSGLFGWFMARRMALPIQRVTATATLLRQGRLETRADEGSHVREIADLALSINALGHSLAEQDALRQRLTSDVSHELRTPLSTLQGNLEAMIDGIWPADTQHLESCREEVLRLARLVRQIENLARAEAETAKLELSVIQLPAFVEQACLRQKADFRDRDISFHWESQPGEFHGDADKLAQVMVNLLSNAAKYTAQGGHVAVTARTTKEEGRQWVEITVRDDGEGIPEKDLPHIFERFYRVDASRSTATGGTGIGLTIARSLVQLHGGRIVAESQPGIGSSFSIWLPADQAVS